MTALIALLAFAFGVYAAPFFYRCARRIILSRPTWAASYRSIENKDAFSRVLSVLIKEVGVTDPMIVGGLSHLMREAENDTARSAILLRFFRSILDAWEAKSATAPAEGKAMVN